MFDFVDKGNLIYFLAPLIWIVILQLAYIYVLGWKEYWDEMSLNLIVAVVAIVIMIWLYFIGWYN